MLKLSLLPLLITIVVLAAGVGFFSLTQRTEQAAVPTDVSTDGASSVAGDVATAFTLAEVATHDNTDDCYIAIQGKVYDVTGFIDQHPGGVDKITSGCGKEMTGMFAAIHSNRAWDLLARFQVGVLSE